MQRPGCSSPAALAALTAAGRSRPALLLTFTFLLGCGRPLTMPAWQALIPELVPRVPAAGGGALGGIGMNLARAVGPAVAGVLIARSAWPPCSPSTRCSFGFLVVLLAPGAGLRSSRADQPERFRSALVAGGRYIRHSRIVRRILLRSLLFVVPGTVVWALLALVASQRLGLGPGGYGLLLAALGVGAVAGAFTLPRLRLRTSTNGSCSPAWSSPPPCWWSRWSSTPPSSPPRCCRRGRLAGRHGQPQRHHAAVPARLGAGPGPVDLPDRVRGRRRCGRARLGTAGRAVRARGRLPGRGRADAGRGGLAALVGRCTTPRAWTGARRCTGRSRTSTSSPSPTTARCWSPPPTVAEDQEPRFLEAMELVRRSRQRTGASRWDLYRDGADRRQFVETFVVPSWAEHLRQHGERLTGTDQALEERAIALADGPPEVQHLFLPRPDPKPADDKERA